MKLLLKLSTVFLLSLAFFTLVATAENGNLAVTCGDQNSTSTENGGCNEGMVTFRGSDLPEQVRVTVLSYPAGTVIDAATYSTSGGNLTFTQTLVPSGAYSVVVSQNIENGTVLTSQTLAVNPLN